jgi:two-component system, NarL family, response regulator YdfI
VNADGIVRVAIAASSDVACAQIETLLSAEADLYVVSSSAPAALPDLLRQANPDVLVLELGSETAEGLEQITERLALPATVLLSSDGRPERHLLELGVRAVLSSRTSAARLAAAIRAVAAGLVVLDEHAAGIGSPSELEPRDEPKRIDALTPRETEVLQLLAEGLPNKAIAGTLGISEHTVKFHLSAIFGKLGATSRTEAVTIGIRQGLVMV